ncbi:MULTISPECIES: hypothetical protein [Buttiauxella]|uniref:hypothetical protein n=1 Tax=Buttiauxella TaxID=82976 RepID=UPI001EDC654D|nr:MULTISPECIES: hypothetical protein [Buttiauxella]UNK62588.1 hypothetical protein MNO13_06540 [Buttiauxella ferragutiae]
MMSAQNFSQLHSSNALLSPITASMDLFQILNVCELLADELIECKTVTEQQALCGRIAHCLEVMKTTFEQPLPAYLVECLTVEKEVKIQVNRDSEIQRQYCHALTQTLLSRAHSADVNRALTGMLFELINELVEDLQAPRFLHG